MKNAKKYFGKLFQLTFLLFLASCAGTPKPTVTETTVLDTKALQNQLTALLENEALSQTQTALKVVNAETGETIFSQAGNKLVNPASNMKLLTTAAALKTLGPNFRFITSALTDSGSVKDSIITGNLYLKGDGNPDLTLEQLYSIADEMYRNGIRQIEGNLIADDSHFDDLTWGNGWMWDDVSSWYWAPINALSVNDNCVLIKVKPGETIGEPVRYELFPNTNYMKVSNFAYTLSPTDSSVREAYDVERVWKPVPQNDIHINGGLFTNDRERSYDVDVIDAALFTGTLFKEYLQKIGITLSGELKRGLTPENADQIAKHTSEALIEIAMNTNKISDNLSAEMLLKKTGAVAKGAPGTAKKGIKVIREMYQEMGIDSTSYRLADGSGVSRYNIITADMLTELLLYMHRDFTIQAEFKTTLPIAGVDGSLSRRMKNTGASGKLRAKTGTLSGVNSLSGYTQSADGVPVIFSMIMSNHVGSSSAIRGIQDKIGQLISEVTLKNLAQ